MFETQTLNTKKVKYIILQSFCPICLPYQPNKIHQSFCNSICHFPGLTLKSMDFLGLGLYHKQSLSAKHPNLDELKTRIAIAFREAVTAALQW